MSEGGGDWVRLEVKLVIRIGTFCKPLKSQGGRKDNGNLPDNSHLLPLFGVGQVGLLHTHKIDVENLKYNAIHEGCFDQRQQWSLQLCRLRAITGKCSC